ERRLQHDVSSPRKRPTAEAVLERMKRFDVIRSQFDDGGPAPGAIPADGPSSAAPESPASEES
ncbi:hypothetical protein ABZZ80_46920, partial [Streptomyces sp. NPDC006356]